MDEGCWAKAQRYATTAQQAAPAVITNADGSAFALRRACPSDGKREGKGYREILRLRVATENRKRRDFREEEIATLRSE